MRLRLLLLSFTCVLFAYSQCKFSNSEVSVSSIKENTWVLETWDKTTMYLLEGDSRALLIDTGTSCEYLDSIIKLITHKPFDVVITHAHPDHAGCIKYFDTIFMHPADSIVDLKELKEYEGIIRFVEEGYKFQLGGRTIEVLHTPGHTPGSISLLDIANGDAYTGDAFGSGQVWLQCQPTLPISVFLKSCNDFEITMTEKGISNIWCGHYPYLKRALDKDYLLNVVNLALQLSNGDQSGSMPFSNEPYPASKSSRIISKEGCSIVYDSMALTDKKNN